MSERMHAPDEFWANTGLITLGAACAFAGRQAAAVWVIAAFTGTAFPELGLWELLTMWVQLDPSQVTGQPSGALWHWSVVALITALVVTPLMTWWSHRTRKRSSDALRHGLASAPQLRKAAGAKQLRARAETLRPSLSLEFEESAALGAGVFCYW